MMAANAANDGSGRCQPKFIEKRNAWLRASCEAHFLTEKFRFTHIFFVPLHPILRQTTTSRRKNERKALPQRNH
jgi:hypothetical protein